MRNAVTRGVSQNCVNLRLRHLELLGNLGGAQTVVKVVENRSHRDARPLKHWSTALDPRIGSTSGLRDQSICSAVAITPII
jgi:hypothetical protein